MQSYRLQNTVRSAGELDHESLLQLIHFETFVHRHLDWIAPLDWIHRPPFLVAEKMQRIIGALSCPIDPPGIAWIRLFGVVADFELEQAWELLWCEAVKMLMTLGRPTVAALSLTEWFTELLLNSGFKIDTNVVFLSWSRNFAKMPDITLKNIRLMNFSDLEQVARVDALAFAPLWTNSQYMLEAAYRQSAISTVATNDEHQIVGYQISTAGPLGGHLARLAVLPEEQGRYIGKALVTDVLSRFGAQDIDRVSVNTQENNPVSLNLYKKLGFNYTGESYPVLKYNLG